VELIGYTGALLLAVCAFPQFIQSLRYGHSNGLSKLFLNSWLAGEVLMLYFIVNAIGPSGPLFYNYLANTIFLTVITYYRYRPRRINGLTRRDR